MRRCQITPLFESSSHSIRKAAALVSILVVLTIVSPPSFAAQHRRLHRPEQTPPSAQTIQASPTSTGFPWISCWFYVSLGLGVWIFRLKRKSVLLRQEYDAAQEDLSQKIKARDHEVRLLKSEAAFYREENLSLQKSLETKTTELASAERKFTEAKTRLSRILEFFPDAEEKAAQAARKKADEKAAIAEARRAQVLSQEKLLAVLDEMKRG